MPTIVHDNDPNPSSVILQPPKLLGIQEAPFFAIEERRSEEPATGRIGAGRRGASQIGNQQIEVSVSKDCIDDGFETFSLKVQI